MKFEPEKPIRPYVLTQKWGVFRPDVYKQFGFTRHNGEDVALPEGEFVRAPFDGIDIKHGFQPNGGGVFLGFISKEEYDFEAWDEIVDGEVIHFPTARCRVLLDFLHLRSILSLRPDFENGDGEERTKGSALAIPDNTGFSTGPHCHIQPRRVHWDGITVTQVDKNDANNSFPLSRFFPAPRPVEALKVSPQVKIEAQNAILKGLRVVLEYFRERWKGRITSKS